MHDGGKHDIRETSTWFLPHVATGIVATVELQQLFLDEASQTYRVQTINIEYILL